MSNKIIITTQQEFNNAVKEQQKLIDQNKNNSKFIVPLIIINGGTPDNPIDIGVYPHFLEAVGNSVIKVKKGNVLLLRDMTIATVMGNTFVELRDGATVYAHNGCTVSTHYDSEAHIYDNCVAFAHDWSHIITDGLGKSRIEVYDHSYVEGYGADQISAFDNVVVDAYNVCVVDAHDECNVNAFGRAHVINYSYNAIIDLCDNSTKEQYQIKKDKSKRKIML